MSEQPAVSSPSFLRRKVAGIPVIYLAAGFVVILAALAWQIKPSAKAADSTGEEPVESADDTILQESDLPPVPLGTVTAPAATVPDTDNASIDTNDEWLRRGVAFLITKGYKPGEAQEGLSLYLDGASVSFEQGEMRDLVIRELGLPPNPVNIGGTRPQPGRIQGTLPRTHIVKVPAEDSAGELAALYYGPGKSWKPIADANGGKVAFKVGDSVKIPVYPDAPAKRQGTPPLTHVVRSATEDSAGELAALYYGPGRSWAPIRDANAGRVKFAIGQSVKVPRYPVPTAK